MSRARQARRMMRRLDAEAMQRPHVQLAVASAHWAWGDVNDAGDCHVAEAAARRHLDAARALIQDGGPLASRGVQEAALSALRGSEAARHEGAGVVARKFGRSALPIECKVWGEGWQSVPAVVVGDAS